MTPDGGHIRLHIGATDSGIAGSAFPLRTGPGWHSPVVCPDGHWSLVQATFRTFESVGKSYSTQDQNWKILKNQATSILAQNMLIKVARTD